MPVYTDSPQYAAALLPPDTAARLEPFPTASQGLPALLSDLFGESAQLHHVPGGSVGSWKHVILSEFASRSQYDRLISMARRGRQLPERVACLAGAGHGFHGFKGRPWAAVAGNLHLSAYFGSPGPVERFGIAYTVLAALSVVDALDRIPGLGGRAGIKWVNDILLDGAKVAGVLAFTQSQAEAVSGAVVGIGLNVETAPPVERTPFVPGVTSVRAVVGEAPEGLEASLFAELLEALDANHRLLVEEGVTPLLDRYRRRSLIVGEEVLVCTETSDQDPDIIARGRVLALGDHLELILEGHEHPITAGRIIWPRAPGQRRDETSVSAADRARESLDGAAPHEPYRIPFPRREPRAIHLKSGTPLGSSVRENR